MRKEVVLAVAVTAAIGVTAGFLAGRRQQINERRWKRLQAMLRRLRMEFALQVPRLWRIANDLSIMIQQSSSDTKDDENTLDMLMSYAGPLPSGDEEGLFYGVNLRGKDFVVSCARLGGKDQPISDIHREEISFPSNIVQGTSTTSQEVFDFMASEVARFVMECPENKIIEQEDAKRLGFTVSYEPHEVSSRGTAVKWKNFSMDDPKNQELTGQINTALEKYGVKMSVLALVPNEVGVLAGGRYYHRDCIASVNLGPGTDAAYCESDPTEQLNKVISTNWGGFRSSHLLKTEYDKDLVLESHGGKIQTFEMLVAGTYLGEIVRRVLLKMAREHALFGDFIPLELKTPYILRSHDVAEMHQDTTEDREVVDEKLSNIFKVTKSTPMVREIVAEVCDIVSERNSRLAAAGIVAILKKLGRIERKKSVVTIEGGLYEHYRVFRNYLHSTIWEMLGKDLSDNVFVEHSHGGPGFSAVFLAAAQANKKC